MERIVVTGMGVVSPIGNKLDEFWRNLISGVSGIGKITRFDASNLPTHIAGEVNDFDPRHYIDVKSARRMARFSQFAVAAASMALDDAKFSINSDNCQRVGVAINTAAGDIGRMVEEGYTLEHQGMRRVSPFLLPIMLANMAACQVSIVFGVKGSIHSNTAACASGNLAILDGMHLIKRGEADFVIAGGTESVSIPLVFAALNQVGAISRRNDEPEKASRPFDLHRDGFVFSEGCAVLILESLEHALRRGANIYAEVAGGHFTCDAYHVTAPEPSGSQAALTVSRALENAQLQPEDIDYVCAHGTGTPLNDVAETLAIKRALGDHAYRVAISSPKSMVGHLLGAAGAISSVAAVLAIRDGIIPPTINLETPDPECDLDYVPNIARKQVVRSAIVNAFGFGGQNAVVVFRQFVPDSSP